MVPNGGPAPLVQDIGADKKKKKRFGAVDAIGGLNLMREIVQALG